MFAQVIVVEIVVIVAVTIGLGRFIVNAIHIVRLVQVALKQPNVKVVFQADIIGIVEIDVILIVQLMLLIPQDPYLQQILSENIIRAQVINV